MACFSETNTTIREARYIFILRWALLGRIIPLIISVILPIVCLCYMRMNNASESLGVQHTKKLAKFSLFLVVGSVINFIGQTLPALLTLGLAAPAAGVYLSYGSAVISLLPTPIIIMAYLKPVREHAKRVVSCGRFPKKQMLLIPQVKLCRMIS